MEVENHHEEITWENPFAERDKITIEEYLDTYKTRITQDSERLFVTDFLFPLLGPEKIKYVIPQYPFIDSEGRNRRIDFAIRFEDKKIALEVNGESYHAEGVLTNETFDDNLNRQNEILNAGWFLLRYSYSQLQSPEWRPRVTNSLFYLLRKRVPNLLTESVIEPNYLQRQVLEALDFYRTKHSWKKGIAILPTGTGKTFLSAFDSLRAEGRILFIVHKIDILIQSKEAFEKVYPNEKMGLLTGTEREHLKDSKVLFASKDSLRNPETLAEFRPDEFDYVIVDEVHHGQAPSYQTVLQYFQPGFFMLGLTATPDRMDRKDIFELFDYQKVFEYSLNEAIDAGFLVPYTYYGLKDNINYNNIRHNGVKYNVADLDRHLIIKDRNERIYEEYLLKGEGNKALGFCASILHANSMASFFREKGVPACAITSASPTRDQLLKDFRESKYSVAFTVDLFNEGVDIPDLRVLLFLRPTESKTVFFQQLGRGLRLCGGKESVVVIDFIGNYKKAGNIRKYLANAQRNQTNPANGRVEKTVYEYSPKCKVVFEAEVEQILDNQDRAGRETTKEDLIAAYYEVAEKLERKPTQDDINEHGEFRMARYLALFGSWTAFLKEIGEITEASYHFPQGTHLGHILYILKSIGASDIEQTRFTKEDVRFNGGYAPDERGNYQRKIKYMLQAAMEMGLLVDFRKSDADSFALLLTQVGQRIYRILEPLLNRLELSFKRDGSWEMPIESSVNKEILAYLEPNAENLAEVRNVFLKMDAVALLLKYLYTVARSRTLRKADLYADFFEAPFVKAYHDRNGIEPPTADARVRRLPFLINILESVGIVKQSASEIEILSFIPTADVLTLHSADTPEIILQRREKLLHYNATGEYPFSDEELSLVKEAFGPFFLTPEYHLPISEQ